MPEIELKNVSKKYENGFYAVKDFNLSIKDKEFVIFVGPSGCGKSTTLRMIAGLEDISEGELFIDGEKVNNVSARDRDIAMVFQNYALYPHMTVRDNIAYSLKIKRENKYKIEEKVNNAAEILGLKELLNRKPGELSGGQKQRVAMGRAIVRNPKVFLMDEPLSNLDAKLRGQLRVEIASLYNKLDSTFIYVTHDQIEAMTLGTRIVVMKDGIIQQVDNPQNLFKYPENKFVAGFIGTPTMNFIESKILLDGDSGTIKMFGYDVDMPYNKFRKVKEHCNKVDDVIVGIRPEDIKIALPGNGKVHGKGKVEVYEMLGAEAIIHLKMNGEKKLVAKIESDTEVKQGDEIYIHFDESKIHIFDRKTEETITN